MFPPKIHFHKIYGHPMEEMTKAYEAKKTDAKWYDFWLTHNFFHANQDSQKDPFCIVIPPPNVTGVLHMGHALVNTLQDILIRWKRMSGFETLWVPGTDHAGIATQTVVERHLFKTTGKKRKDFSREEFLAEVWKWKTENEGQILSQLKKMGCSCDWSRLRFTMDPQNNRAVRVMFKKLFDEGLIYRGDYLVNWDPVTQTALADDEVEYEEKSSFLWHFLYPLTDGSGYIKIATTRPETMLGDTAIAVSPKDPRYTSLIGKTVVLPLIGREIPIIADHHVDPEFGTGAVKVTPAHDPNDYQIGISHKLPFVNIMTPDGKINEHGGSFNGLTMEEARTAIVAEMKNQGLLEKIEPHTHRVGVSYRSKAIIEPYLSKQWFVRMGGFAKQLLSAVKENKITLIPKNWESTYFHWIENLRDWCISRQLWWGHRIPIWYNKEDPERILCFDGEGEPEEVKLNPNVWTQEDDVLDTWFSSALWPFATLGWPDNTGDLKKFYPNSVLVTGHDILFFWVARMLFMGEYALGMLPFPEVFLHGLIYGKSYWRDLPGGGISYLPEQERHSYDLGAPLPKDVHYKWEKMSKSKGNIIDPIEIIEEYGTDAMRMALCASANQAREIDLDRRRFDEFKNFANKIWNGARFVFLNLEGDSPLTSSELAQGLDLNLLRLEDRWILSKLNQIIKSVNQKLENYQFDQAANEAYDFFWKEFCAYYLEISKPILTGKVGELIDKKNKQKILTIVLCSAVRFIHPMAPFITEELFQQIKRRFSNFPETATDPYTQECLTALCSAACIVAPFPQILREEDINSHIEELFSLMERVVYNIRNIRGEMKLPPGMATDVYVIGKPADPILENIKNHTSIITALVKVNNIIFEEQEPSFPLASTGIIDSVKMIIPLPRELMKNERSRLEKEKDRILGNLEKLRRQLSNKEFVQNAPAELVAKQQEQLLKLEQEEKELQNKLSNCS